MKVELRKYSVNLNIEKYIKYNLRLVILKIDKISKIMLHNRAR